MSKKHQEYLLGYNTGYGNRLRVGPGITMHIIRVACLQIEHPNPSRDGWLKGWTVADMESLEKKRSNEQS